MMVIVIVDGGCGSGSNGNNGGAYCGDGDDGNRGVYGMVMMVIEVSMGW